MASSEPVFLRAVELRLLRFTLSHDSPPPPPSSHPPPAALPNPLRPLVEDLLDSIERGNYADALSSDATRLVFGFADSWEFEDSVECAARFYDEVERSVELFLRNGNSAAWLQVLDADTDADMECRCALLMCVGVASLLAFTQQNVTGPVGSFSPFPLLFSRSKKDGVNISGGEWDVWARNQLSSVGSDVQGKFPLLQYIVYAKILLSKIKDLYMEGEDSCLNGSRSISWWLSRLVLLQQRILDELSSSLYDLLQLFKNNTLLQFGELEKVTNYWGSMLYEGEALRIVSMSQLEAGIIDYKYGRVDSSRVHLRCAEEASGLHLSVTGALGFRTIHQVDAKPQLVLVANTDQQIHGGGSAAELSQAQSNSNAYENKKDSNINGHYDCCDILMAPRLMDSDNVSTVNGVNGDLIKISKDTTLTAIQQAVVLAQCLHLSRINHDDELSSWEMAPYIEAVDAQHQSCYSIRSFCDILRIRWESTRSRTKQRALLMMDKLVEVVYEAIPMASQRIQLAYGVYIPTIPALRKEYGELLVSCGMIGEALKFFEDLELWDNLIYCYRLLGKKAAAVDLIKARLSDIPNDPRLWCSLGDVTNTDAYYEKALEVSKNKSARAMRSLARRAYNRGDYETSKILWESALAVKFLIPDGWFALGAAALKARDIDKALDAFTRAVQLDPDNGEAWNNIACLHMIKKKGKSAFIAFKEAIKFRRNSWQLWENFSHVALDVGNFRQALEAIKMVLDLSNNKRVDVELLDKIMRKVEERTSKPAFSSFDVLESDYRSNAFLTKSSDECGCSESILKEPRETEFLLDMLGNILQQIIRMVVVRKIYGGLYARWTKIKGNLTMCSEALLKQVRSFQGSELCMIRDRFKKFAHASLQLCKVYMEIGFLHWGSRRELITAEMHLRSSVKQAVNFTDTEEFRELEACLDEIKKQLDVASTEGA
ncbi:LOW QUALITY PROTEIN: tetratricopeptide repeat protein 27 homolog [Phoenix dactylifera]|uniref:LOW QUALITY PROTEIN: tetratricopeptide repeat protein 27 homolog n=1 Tax=Phoenix dactylifera TaxID=42345 RepID=A0A8B9AGX5_PHODC|nr:LOW QUALITY PROTEIN: tetratricopeptide repeat protein 27 homolog [Phoenix dactylifera]